jgi:hypothetical protein
MLISDNFDANSSALGYIGNNGILSFIHTFVLTGIYNIFDVLSKISLPYLFILLPFGIIFSFRAFDQNTQYIKANWIFILASLGLMVVTFSIVPERRYLFFLFPFLIIFATIPIQRVVEYGLSTFAFSNKQKNVFLIIVIGFSLTLSLLLVVYQYGQPDLIFENEKIEFAKFVVHNLDGKILDESGPALEYVSYVLISESPTNFKNYKISQNILEEYQKTNKLDRLD